MVKMSDAVLQMGAGALALLFVMSVTVLLGDPFGMLASLLVFGIPAIAAVVWVAQNMETSPREVLMFMIAGALSLLLFGVSLIALIRGSFGAAVLAAVVFGVPAYLFFAFAEEGTRMTIG